MCPIWTPRSNGPNNARAPATASWRCVRSGRPSIASDDARRAAERAAREHYSRLVASLAAQFRDVAAAEDALADSLLAALAQWPELGVPDNPAAWLLAVARRKLVDDLRRRKTAASAVDRLLAETQTAVMPHPLHDKRLDLLFACAHPAIDESVRAPLMLQVVFGLDAGMIGGLFLTSPAAMAQRLVRAKQKIRDARIPFDVPEPPDYGERLRYVLEAIYALFTRDGVAWHGGTDGRDSLADEAIWLGHLVTGLSKRHPEALGLMALMLYVESRRKSRRDRHGRFVPLSEQSVMLWDTELIGRAENLLAEAAAKNAPGRFQIEAAIQSVHAARAQTGKTDWGAILRFYDALLGFTPSLVAPINRAVAVLHVSGAADALADLDSIATDPRVENYQPYWAARAHVLAQHGEHEEARQCYRRAVGLEPEESVRCFLQERIRVLEHNFDGNRQ